MAILAESRFPGCAAAGGDITRHDAEEIVKWVNSILPVPVSLPVCFDIDRLYARMEALYPDADAVHARIEELYRGSEADFLAACMRESNEHAALSRMKEQLAGYTTLDQIGAVALIGRFLQLTGDPARLIALVEEANTARTEKARFPLKELFRLTYTRFSGPVSAPVPTVPKRRTKTQRDVRADVLRNLTGQDDPGCFIAPARLLETGSGKCATGLSRTSSTAPAA